VCIEALAASPSGVPESVLLGAVADPDPGVRRCAVHALARAGEPKPSSGLEEPLDREPDTGLRRGGEPAPSFVLQLRSLLRDDDPEVRAETAVALGSAGGPALAQMARSADAATAVAALRRLPPVLAELARQRAEDADPAVRASALEATARLASSVSIGRDRLERDLDHEDPRVRGAAVSALAATAAAGAASFQIVAMALADPSRDVRSRAVEALSGLGEEGARVAVPYLTSESEGTVEASSEVMAPHGFARKLLASELRRRIRLAWGDLLALRVLPKGGNLSARFLRAAHIDSVRRNERIAFALLRGSEDPGVVKSIERALRLGSPRARARALEVLSNLGDRDAVGRLVLMLEHSAIEDKIRTVSTAMSAAPDLDRAMDADRRAFDVWIRMGEDYYRKQGEGDVSQRDTMERLLLLRDIPLFAGLSLHQLEAINQLMTERYYMRDEVVCREGDPGGELYLLLEGKAEVVADHGTPEEVILNTLEAPSYFGEMAVLDEQPRSATVVVSEDARLLALDGDAFKELMLQSPEISFQVCQQLSSRIRVLESASESRA
jgi:HEAT repeat protein